MHRFPLFASCLTLALAQAAAAAPWQVAGEPRIEPLGPGIEYVRTALENAAAGGGSRRTATLHLVRFGGPGLTLKVVDQGDAHSPRYAGLADAMQANFCIAGCNGGFFHPDFRPAGLVIADGRRINRFEIARLLSGVLVVDDKGPRLLRRAEFVDRPGISQLLQSGPFLVDGGRPVAGLSDSPARKRTFVMTDGRARWAIGVCTGVSLAELGAILAGGEGITGFRVTRALNLDGGSSSCLYFSRGAGIKPHHDASLAKPRNFLGIAPR